MKSLFASFLILMSLSNLQPAFALHRNPAIVSWTRQHTTAGHDRGHDVSVDSLGNIFSTGSYESQRNTLPAVYTAKYNDRGNLQWNRFLNSGLREQGTSVAGDETGGAFVSGYTTGNIAGTGNDGYRDIFIARYNSQGLRQWATQISVHRPENETGHPLGSAAGLAVDDMGNVYAAGTVQVIKSPSIIIQEYSFLQKYNIEGQLQWSQNMTLDSRFLRAADLDIDQLGNIFIAGTSLNDDGSRSSADSFVSKFDTDGNQIWTQRIATDQADHANSISTDDLGNAYISGTRPDHDNFIFKVDSEGDVLWERDFSAEITGNETSVSADIAGNIYIAGTAPRGLNLETTGSGGMYLSKFDTVGNQLWTHRFGSFSGHATGLASDELGALYISGFYSASASIEPFVTKIFDREHKIVPEPSAVSLLLLAFACCSSSRRAFNVR